MRKTTADTEAESMVSVTIQQDTSVIPPMMSPVIGPMPRPDSPNVHGPLPTTTTTTSTTTTTTLPLPPQPQQALVRNVLDKQGWRNNKLDNNMDIPKMIREQETVKFIDSIRRLTRKVLMNQLRSKQDCSKTPWVTTSPPPPLSTTAGESGASVHKPGSRRSAQAPPPPPPFSSTHQGGQSTSIAAPSSSKTVASAEYSAWTTIDTRIKPSITIIPDDLYMDDETTADEQACSSGEEVGRDHIPTVNLRQSW
ncbi:hypothetical protein Tco_1004177 [Tanacetum coccineum]|uniref:Uncharacterized protein n=1 Tax=Tanacetum coccineum TaxID=301880 RepID=A0ABQ5FBS6_9ASTR